MEITLFILSFAFVLSVLLNASMTNKAIDRLERKLEESENPIVDIEKKLEIAKPPRKKRTRKPKVVKEL